MRMAQDQVIAAASGWVRDRYPVVPPVGLVLEFSEEKLDAIERQQSAAGVVLPAGERRYLANKWVVSFCGSWDTDALGMPMGLQVVVDDATGQAERLPPAAP